MLIAFGAEHQYVLDSLIRFFPKVRIRKIGDVVNFNAIDMKPQKLPTDLKVVFESDLNNLVKYVGSLADSSDEKKEMQSKRVPGLRKIIEDIF